MKAAICPGCQRAVEGLVATIAKNGQVVAHVIELKRQRPVLVRCHDSKQPLRQPNTPITKES
jgi:hypothetical protein